mmetsp:Transcript_72759/g.168655  ORF Transcript_72759/g.168655 Transcript_72759/m.168655 type:complete len:205 (-) Transcript_72759:322-936(-)
METTRGLSQSAASLRLSPSCSRTLATRFPCWAAPFSPLSSQAPPPPCALQQQVRHYPPPVVAPPWRVWLRKAAWAPQAPLCHHHPPQRWPPPSSWMPWPLLLRPLHLPHLPRFEVFSAPRPLRRSWQLRLSLPWPWRPPPALLGSPTASWRQHPPWLWLRLPPSLRQPQPTHFLTWPRPRPAPPRGLPWLLPEVAALPSRRPEP